MSSIRWLLAVLRKLILGNTLVRASIRGLVFLFALLRTTKQTRRPGSASSGSQTLLSATDHGGGYNSCAVLPVDTETRVVYASSSVIPTSLHPYSNSTSSDTSQSSPHLTTHSITHESYPLHNLSVQHLPATFPVQQPTASTLSVQHLPALPPSPNLGPGGYLPSTNSSVADLHLAGPATESLSQSRPSSVHRDVEVESLPCLNDVHPRIFPVTPENVQRYTRKTTIPNDPTKFRIKPLTISVTA
ncbi:hypothetical protein DFH08DRAFT_406879 [Mycena albidolilacea]|uniref:Uncharacterized protein n=1 Tax=Mycena albidolilacea TaxID=1033008 RepID=A0AAD7EZV6_9AGAR|nr:hypothetical protein DFH08DRAFT_406879 [Mycena albidolilacea]